MTELRTARLVLRRAIPDDLDAMHAVLSDPRAMTYWSHGPHEGLDQTREWLDSMLGSPPELSEDFVVTLDVGNHSPRVEKMRAHRWRPSSSLKSEELDMSGRSAAW